MSRNNSTSSAAAGGKSSKQGGPNKGGPPRQRDETDSFIAEVSEELRRDRLNRAFRRYGPFFGALIAVIVLGAAGYEFWKSQTISARRDAGGLMARAAQSEDPAEAFGDAAGRLEGGARVVAELAAATAHAQDGASAEAVPHYESIQSIEGVDPLYRQLAELREVMARIGAEEPRTLLAELAPLSEAGAPFSPLALELEAGLRLELGEIAEARNALQAALADPRGSAGQRRRLQTLLDSLPPEASAGEAQGGAKDEAQEGAANGAEGGGAAAAPTTD